MWINDDKVNDILKNDDYQKNQIEQNADIVVFKKDGNIVHSGTRNPDGTYNDAGILKLEKNVTLNNAARGLTDVNKKGNVEFDCKNTPNRIVDTTLGTVDDRGNRIIRDKKEIKQFMKQIQGQ